MLDVSLSPGDPTFWLHHTYLDKLWWQWQSLNLSSRLTDISGQNTDPSMSAGLAGFGGFGTNLTGLDFSCFGAGFPFTMNSTLNTTGTGLPTLPMPIPINPAFVDYFNDGGNVTTLNHVLNSAGIAKNATVGDVMDIRDDYVCAEYL